MTQIKFHRSKSSSMLANTVKIKSSLENCYDGRTEEGSTREKETESVNTKSPAINKGH